MQFSEHWLREFVDPQLDTEALGHLLTMAGLEVEECDPVAADFQGVVVARIVDTAAHPDADKLKVCEVDDGSGEMLQIVCGAPNAAAGMFAPLARIGAELGDFKIKKAKLRGVESSGMLCSARELGISDAHEGLLALPADAPVGADVRAVLGLDDHSFTIKLTPNRADCLSLAGVAREVSALTGAPLSLPDTSAVPASIADVREIVLDAPAACPRYCGRIVRGVDARAATPEWMVRRLERSGVRSISVLVDITNYVMLELGQPLHAFDDARLEGAIHVRLPRAGEELLLLNEQTVKPAADTLLIADDSRALALAGIMGGEDSGITLDTADLFLESAFFAPDAIAGRARQYNFGSDASHRFERGVDFELPRRTIERATRLILDLCGGAAGPVVEAVSEAHLPVRAPVALRPQRARRVLGLEIDDNAMAELLERVHLEVRRDGECLSVVPPSWRFDIAIEADLIEEIVRLHGYDDIPARTPVGPMAMLAQDEGVRTVWSLRRQLAARDFQEVINYAFVDVAWERDFCGVVAPVKLANPIASQMGVMRTSLIGGLVDNLIANRNRQLVRVRVFETGRCFVPVADGGPVAGFEQPLRIAALAAGPALPEQWGTATRRVDFFDLKADLEALIAPRVAEFRPLEHPALHPGRAAEVSVDGVLIGVIGELHPKWVEAYDLGAAPVMFELDLPAALASGVPAYRELSRFPAVSRDIALIVDSAVAAAELMAALRRAAPPIVQAVELFDVYQGKGVADGKKSLAFRVLMQDTQRTLEDSEVESAISAIVREADASFGATLRG
ncbi:phenylalanine--tRNA ligase subunit beta [Pseudazoarcus pumilus]|uniref:Phenylalanine--tRNA ligase beta subunit n=1 Tax=Pseudazoarcus pumilus TaxID=2067960 RepID=A0A2I6S5S5_9RHOO|nr:phenylalanine--tRNA ligase subunit beta [Pseudazoarcus pumilus]AUN94604.1 phenylalanine--tRNA ligase subunit beta [Pseudazoarcus pumilus]